MACPPRMNTNATLPAIFPAPRGPRLTSGGCPCGLAPSPAMISRSGARRRRPARPCGRGGVPRRRLERHEPGAAGPRARARRQAPSRSRSMRSTTPRSARRRAARTSSCTRSIRPTPTGRGSPCRSPIPPSTAAETTGATLMFPGNLYNYGVAHAAGDRRDHADAAVVPQGADARGDRRSHGRGHRTRHARDRSARRRFLRRRTRIMARSRAAQGDRPRPPDLSRPDRPGA